MKLNRIMLISIFLLAVLTLGVVSASDNAENLEMQKINFQADDLIDSIGDEVISDDAGDDVVSQISGEDTSNFTQDDGEDAFGDDESSFQTLAINDDEMTGLGDCDIYPESTVFHYGFDNNIVVIVGADRGGFDIYIDDVKQKYDVTSDMNKQIAYVAVKNVKDTQFKLKVDYKGDGTEYGPKTVTYIIDVVPFLYAKDISFGNSSDIVINFFDGETIKFVLSKDNAVVDEKTIIVNNSKAIYPTPDNLEFGKKYQISYSYKNYTDVADFSVIPKMNLPGMFYFKEQLNVTIELPEEYRNLAAKIDLNNNIIFNGTFDNDSKISFELPVLKPGQYYKFTIKVFDGNNSIYSYSKLIYSHGASSDVDLDLNLSDEYVTGKIFFFDLNLDVLDYIGESDGIWVLVDGAKYKKITPVSRQVNIETKKLQSNKIHNITFKFDGTEYFKAFVKEYLFKLVPYLVDVPENPLLNNNEFITVILPDDSTGTVTLYADGKQLNKIDVAENYDGYLINIDEDGNHYVKFRIDDLNLALGSHNVRIVYKGNKQAFDITKKINLGYAISTNLKEVYKYGDENIIEFVLPIGGTGSFSILVDGKQFKNYSKYRDVIKVDISELMGTHEITVKYSGDSKYNYPFTLTGRFNVTNNIELTGKDIPYKSDAEYVTLVLPKNATGSLVVELNGEVYAKKILVNGRAGISFANLSLGSYDLKAYYDGNDYAVDAVEDTLAVKNMILISKTKIEFDETVEVYINSPYHGFLSVDCDGVIYTEDLINGSARIVLSNLPLGTHFIYAECVGEEDSFAGNTFDVQVNPIVTLPKEYVVFAKNTLTIEFPPYFEGSAFIGFDDDEPEIRVRSNGGKVTCSLPYLYPGKHTLYVFINSDDENVYAENSWDIYVYPAANPKLTATSASVYCGDQYNVQLLGIEGLPLKGAKVTFKVGKNKAVTRTTNAQGIATLNMNYKPAKYTVVVKYAKQTLKPKVTVKKVLTLKTVAVKKSARKLVLTATLKKGKTPIKGKVVTFKFNGKTYKAKTSKTGVAKYTIKKSVLNKLRVGKKVVYQATYIKDVVKKSAKVKR